MTLLPKKAIPVGHARYTVTRGARNRSGGKSEEVRLGYHERSDFQPLSGVYYASVPETPFRISHVSAN